MDIQIAGYPDNLWADQVTIASGASASEMIATEGRALVGIVVPAAWTAAGIGFKVSFTGRTNDLKVVCNSSGTPMTTAAPTVDTFVAFPMSDAAFAPFLQITSVTADSSTGVNQAAARTVILIFRKLLS